MFSLKERLKQANRLLAPYAVPHEGKLGRRAPEEPDATRFPFQRDRDRILHSQAFRRLQGKTQVFLTGEGDHYRTRLTHTMEVSQIARSIARALALNEDLAECIALAHDLGHPPFGHAGEDALNRWMQAHGGHFEHNEQSHRIVTLLERHSSQQQGLNLNREVEEGLLKHPSDPMHNLSLEAQAVNIADEIAYLSHDSDDGLSSNLLTKEKLLEIPLAAEAREHSHKRGTLIRGALVHTMVLDLIEHSLPKLQHNPANATITHSPSMLNKVQTLKVYLHEHLYLHATIQKTMSEGKRVVTLLCDRLLSAPPLKLVELQQSSRSSLPEAVKDYIAGMTDHFAMEQVRTLG